MTALLALACAVAAGVTALGLLALLRWAPGLGLLDLPKARSSHRQPRPRGGGVAIVAGLLSALAILTAGGEALSGRASVVLGAAFALAAIGLWDDFAHVRARVRLVAQLAVAALLVGALGGFTRVPLPAPANLELPPAVGAALAVLWLVAVTNFFNFMDGIDGLAAGQALVTCFALALPTAGSASARLAWPLVAALLVFLLFNWAPARLFLGDSGSGFLGCLLAASPWLGAPAARESSLLLVATSLALFLLDPLWTLAVRWRAGARLTEPHRHHLYQQLVDRRGGHGPVAALLLAAGALLTVLAIWSRGEAARGWAVLGVAGGLFLGEVALSRRVIRQHRPRRTRPGAPESTAGENEEHE